jgi:hypothetical protein
MNLTAKALSLVWLAQLAPSVPVARTAPAPRVLAPSPAPPAPPRSGTWVSERDRAYRADRLRQKCLSERGIRLILDSQDQSTAEAVARSSVDERPIYQELGEAANAVPLDLQRLERALASRAAYQAAQQERFNREAIALLRRLSPGDRAIYAEELSPMRAYPARQPCPSVR